MDLSERIPHFAPAPGERLFPSPDPRHTKPYRLDWCRAVAVDAGHSGCLMTAADIAVEDSREFGSAVEQHCSAKLPSQEPLHSRVAYADAGLGSAAPALGWQVVPVSFVLHCLRLAGSVHRKRARGKRDRSIWVAREAADRAVEKGQ